MGSGNTIRNITDDIVGERTHVTEVPFLFVSDAIFITFNQNGTYHKTRMKSFPHYPTALFPYYSQALGTNGLSFNTQLSYSSHN